MARQRSAMCVKIRMKYVDASAVLRILLMESGPRVPLAGAERVVSSQLVEIESYRAIDRLRFLGALDDATTAIKRKELGDFLARLHLAPIDRHVIDRARASFSVNVRALDAIHVATAEVLASEANGEAVAFWTHDDRQATAALSRGLSVHGLR